MTPMNTWGKHPLSEQGEKEIQRSDEPRNIQEQIQQVKRQIDYIAISRNTEMWQERPGQYTPGEETRRNKDNAHPFDWASQ